MSQEWDEKGEVARLAGALRTMIKLSEVSHRHIERSLHLSTGYLTRILKGEAELQVRHVLGICRVIGLPPGVLFAVLFPPAPPATVNEIRLVRGLRALHPLQSDPEPRVPEPHRADLLHCLDQLRELLLREEGCKV